MTLIKRYVLFSLVVYAGIALVYWVAVRPSFFNWGASANELSMKLPADQWLPAHSVVSTRAINIKANASQVYPWIAQTGENRGGFNSYTWLENLFGAKMVNALTMHKEWMDIQPGDTVYYGKNQLYGLVSVVKKNEFYAIGGWTFFLQPLSDSETRLIVRYPSMDLKQNTLNSIYYYGILESLHFTMEAGMMMGIRQKAEQLAKDEKRKSAYYQ